MQPATTSLEVNLLCFTTFGKTVISGQVSGASDHQACESTDVKLFELNHRDWV